MHERSYRATRLLSGAAGVAIAATVLAGCGGAAAGTTITTTTAGAAHTSAGQAVSTDKSVALHSAMRQLWQQHMEWTYATVDAFFHNQKALSPTLKRLLANQTDIGDAIAPYYGTAAGHQLTKLLKTHINEAVPVLQAAKAGNATKLAKAEAAWYANAKQIADFLSEANPDNWPKSATEPMLKAHITQTTAYSVDLLKGHYAAAIKAYDKAEKHMLMLADIVSDGVIAQFPQQFA